MPGRTLLPTALLLLSVFLSPLSLSTPSVCALAMPMAASAQCAACCATMKSCVMPRSNPGNVATAASVDHEFVSTAPLAPVVLDEPWAKRVACFSAVRQREIPARPRHAVLCTFLI